jgi:hypothetical protein
VKTVADFTRLASQRTWDKDVVVWLGPESSLLEALPAGLDRQAVDLLDLLDEKALPDAEADAALLLRRSLRQRLTELAPSGGQRRIVIVKSAGLLVRCDLGLREFFDWFCGDHGLAVVLIEATPNNIGLPPGIECRPRVLVDYFHRPDLAKHLIVAF